MRITQAEPEALLDAEGRVHEDEVRTPIGREPQQIGERVDPPPQQPIARPPRNPFRRARRHVAALGGNVLRLQFAVGRRGALLAG